MSKFYDQNQLSQLIASVQGIGIQADNIPIDGQFHRFRVSGKKGLPGWIVARQGNGKLFANFGDWSTQQKYTFMDGQNDTANLSQDDLRVMALLEEQRREEEAKRQRKAAKDSLAIWEASPPCPENHPYPVSRKVRPHGARYEKSTGALLINIIDRNGNHVSIQRIWDKSQKGENEPTKLLFKYGQKKGCFHIIEGKRDRVYIAEGFATGATINELTGCMVFVAIDAGNLLSVAKNVREIYPDWKNPQPITIAADNDHTKKENVGLIKAREAAEEIGADLIYPEGIEGSDFNDMRAELGDEATRAALSADKEPERPRVKEFDFIHVSELLANIRPTDWLIEPFLEAQSLAVIFGEPGAFKSFLTIAWGLCVATGAQWMGHEVKQGPVFSLIGEGHNGYAKRVAAWAKATGTDAGNAPFYISTVPAAITEIESAMQVMRKIDKLTSIHGKPELVIIDTLNRNFGPGDENSTVDMSRFIGNLDYYIGNDFSRLIVHHTGHGDKTRARGSSALRGAVDAEYRLAKEGEILTLYCEKMKDSAKFAPVTLRPILINIGGAINKPIDSYHLEKAEAPPQKEKRLPQAQQIALDALQAVAGDTGEANLEEWRQEAYAKGISASGKPDARQKAFVRAVSGLREAGRIDTRDDVYWIAGHART